MLHRPRQQQQSNRDVMVGTGDTTSPGAPAAWLWAPGLRSAGRCSSSRLLQHPPRRGPCLRPARFTLRGTAIMGARRRGHCVSHLQDGGTAWARLCSCWGL